MMRIVRELDESGRTRCAGALLVVAALAAYANSLGGPFVFDDLPSILENPTIERLWPLTGPLAPPAGGFTVSGRPLVNLSLAVNRAISGTGVWSYHAFNLLVHVLAGLTLFGLVRRTLLLPRMAARWRDVALPVAWLTALLWLVHPLQTEAVTYVIQRAEAMMALAYLATLYAFVRTVEAEAAEPPRRCWQWRIATVGLCALGMACKEVMVTAPVAVLLFDRTFVEGSFGAAVRKRWGFYLALAVTWLPLAGFVAMAGAGRGGTFDLTRGATVRYWLTQFEALTHYVWLAVWPSPLVFEYGASPVPALGEVWPYAAAVVTGLVVTGWAWARGSAAGFLGATFFLVLAPTTLMPGIVQQIVEHRMYLPLAALIALVVGAAVRRWRRAAVGGFLVVAVVAGVATARRNAVYADDLELWRDTVAKRPQSGVAQSNLALAFYRRDRLEEALRHNEQSLVLQPRSAQMQFNLGLILEKLGRREEALPYFLLAAGAPETKAEALYRSGQVLIALGRSSEALAPLTAAAALQPAPAGVDAALGVALAENGRWAEAVAADERALQAKANDVEAEGNLGAALFRLGRDAEAETHLRRAVKLNPRRAAAWFNLGLVLATTGRGADALGCYAEAVRLAPEAAESRLNLGIALAQAGRTAEALPQLEAAVRLRADWPEAHANLGLLLGELGCEAEAGGHLREALRLRPDYPMAREAMMRLESGR